MKRSLKGQNGFTLIELLIVIAILGILAAVIIPNVNSFITSGRISAANQEVASLNTAQEAFTAENGGTYAANSSGLSAFLYGTLRASYTFNTTTGQIATADATIAGGWGNTIDFKLSTQQWQRGTTGKNIP